MYGIVTGIGVGYGWCVEWYAATNEKSGSVQSGVGWFAVLTGWGIDYIVMHGWW